jgi:hypothetical protein
VLSIKCVWLATFSKYSVHLLEVEALELYAGKGSSKYKTVPLVACAGAPRSHLHATGSKLVAKRKLPRNAAPGA